MAVAIRTFCSRSFLTSIAALALILTLPMSLAAQAEPLPRTITVSGEGQISVKPDIAYVQTGVVTQAKTAVDALTANTQAMQAVFNGLKELGIEDRDIRTSQLSINPVYTHEARGTKPVITGYQASNMVSLTLRDLDRVGEALDKIVSLGSNQLHGIRFDVEKPGPLLDAARADAVKDAIRKAKILVSSAGVALGQIITINENSGGGGGPQFYARAMTMESSDVPVAAGEQMLTSNVTLVIAIE
ncbi:MAG: SIMPL domain-containing protein [Parvibaculum sp.]